MEPLGPLGRAIIRYRQQRAAPPAAGPRSRGEQAIDRYIAWCDGYSAALTRKSEREAAKFVATGVPASALPHELAEVKPDRTHVLLRTYEAWLAQLRMVGLYDGPVTLRRMRRDGSWEPSRPGGSVFGERSVAG